MILLVVSIIRGLCQYDDQRAGGVVDVGA
eukprot:COSAG05_NODE_17910_length_317_cov_0.866972_1_plen_28_part_01